MPGEEGLRVRVLGLRLPGVDVLRQVADRCRLGDAMWREGNLQFWQPALGGCVVHLYIGHDSLSRRDVVLYYIIDLPCTLIAASCSKTPSDQGVFGESGIIRKETEPCILPP